MIVLGKLLNSMAVVSWKVSQEVLILVTACRICIFIKIIDCNRVCKLVEKKLIGIKWWIGVVKVIIAITIFTIIVDK